MFKSFLAFVGTVYITVAGAKIYAKHVKKKYGYILEEARSEREAAERARDEARTAQARAEAASRSGHETQGG